MVEKGIIISSRSLTDTDLILDCYGCSAPKCSWSLPPSTLYHEALRVFGRKHNSLVHFNDEAYLTQRYRKGELPIEPIKHFWYRNNWEKITDDD